MKLPKTFIKLDFFFQLLIGILILGTSWIGLGIFLLLPFGAWQLLSALILIVAFGNRERRNYLICTVSYFFIAGIALFEQNIFDQIWGLFAIIPPILGIWYFVITYRDYKKISSDDEDIDEDTTYEALITKQ